MISTYIPPYPSLLVPHPSLSPPPRMRILILHPSSLSYTLQNSSSRSTLRLCPFCDGYRRGDPPPQAFPRRHEIQSQ
jgi:hypothetical protein